MGIAQIRERATGHLFNHLSDLIQTESGTVPAIIKRHDEAALQFKGGKRTAATRWQYLIIHVREQDADSITGTVHIDGRDWEPVDRTRHVVQPGIVQIELAPVDGHGEAGEQWL